MITQTDLTILEKDHNFERNKMRRKIAIPWFNNLKVKCHCADKPFVFDMELEKFGEHILSPKYEKVLRNMFGTIDKKELLDKVLHTGKLPVYVECCDTVELMDIHSGRSLGRVANNMVKKIISSNAEKAVEDFLHSWLQNNPKFHNRVFSVGGYPRDKLWGIDSDDLDLVVDIPGGNGAEKLTKALYQEFGNDKLTHPIQQRNYPIWKMSFKDDIEYEGKTYFTKGAEIDFADPQKESFPDEGSRQRITEPATLKEDSERRDLTINSLMENLTTREFVDLTGYAINDIMEGNVRIHPDMNWDKIVSDDPLRMIRFLRFYVTKPQLKKLEKPMLDTIERNAKQIQKVSPERIMDELKKVMKTGKLHKAMELMKETGLLNYIIPEMQSLIDTEHDMPHTHLEKSIWAHTILVLKNAPPTIEGQLAALLHDVGKPQTKQEIEGKYHFYKHDKIGAEIAEAILRRLHFDNETISKVRKLVDTHMRTHSFGGRDLNTKEATKALRKYIREMGDILEEALSLAEADIKGTLPLDDNYIEKVRNRIKEIKEEVPEVKIKPVLDGHEIMNILNIKAGPLIGKISKFLLDLQDENPKITKEEAKEKIIENFGGNEMKRLAKELIRVSKILTSAREEELCIVEVESPWIEGYHKHPGEINIAIRMSGKKRKWMSKFKHLVEQSLDKTFKRYDNIDDPEELKKEMGKDGDTLSGTVYISDRSRHEAWSDNADIIIKSENPRLIKGIAAVIEKVVETHSGGVPGSSYRASGWIKETPTEYIYNYSSFGIGD